MKKFLGLLTLIGIFFMGMSYGADIGDVALRFCNASGTLEKTVALTTSGQEKKEICMILINGAYEPVDISISFVDGTITNDADQKKACKNEGENQTFGKYMNVEKNIINIPARGSTTFTGTLQLPEETVGEVHGCVTYFINNQKNQKDMFTIMVRRANFIDILAKGIVTVGLSFVDTENQEQNISDNTKIAAEYTSDEKKLYLQSVLKNKGTAEQGVTIKGEIKNRLGYKKTFFEEKRTIFGKETTNINNVIEDLPFYAGPFTITYSVEHNANIGEGLQTDGGEQTGTITETAHITILTAGSYSCLVGILIIIACISFVVFKKSHKVAAKTHTTSKHTTTKKHKNK